MSVGGGITARDTDKNYCPICELYNWACQHRGLIVGLETFDASKPQPTPVGNGKDVTKLVCSDLELRSQAGEKKYGTRLKTFNGRSALIDAYQEALDLVCYLRQLIEEESEL